MPVWPVFYCLVKAQGRTGLVDEGLQQSEQGHSEAMCMARIWPNPMPAKEAGNFRATGVSATSIRHDRNPRPAGNTQRGR